jgi:hypothetical protein
MESGVFIGFPECAIQRPLAIEVFSSLAADKNNPALPVAP